MSAAPARLLLVGQNPANLGLLARFLATQGYATESLASTDISRLQTPISDFDLALVDISGFDKTVWELCEKLNEKAIPLLIISARQSVALQKESITHGALGVLVKPLVSRELAGLVRSMLDNAD